MEKCRKKLLALLETRTGKDLFDLPAERSREPTSLRKMSRNNALIPVERLADKFYVNTFLTLIMPNL